MKSQSEEVYDYCHPVSRFELHLLVNFPEKRKRKQGFCNRHEARAVPVSQEKRNPVQGRCYWQAVIGLEFPEQPETILAFHHNQLLQFLITRNDMGKFVLKHPAGDNTQYGHVKPLSGCFLITDSIFGLVRELLINSEKASTSFLFEINNGGFLCLRFSITHAHYSIFRFQFSGFSAGLSFFNFFTPPEESLHTSFFQACKTQALSLLFPLLSAG